MEEQDNPDSENQDSFWFMGTSNYHLRLEESEKRIDGMLNNTLGKVLPRWERPTTFKDWCEDWRVWDLWGGYGRDINAYSSWTVYTGGGIGTIPNGKRYFPLGIPLRLDADFTRKSLLVGSSISYYPWGRPVKKEPGFVASLKAARPVAEINLGYTYQISIGDVKASLPLAGNILHIKDEKRYHLFWLSPRIGVEAPITDKDSLNVLVGYTIMHQHGPEYNGAMLEFFVRHRF